MSRIHVVDRQTDNSPLEVVGWFESDDAQVFGQLTPPLVRRSGGFLSRSEEHEIPQQLLRTGEGRWVLRLDSCGSRGVEYRYVGAGEASAWLCRNGHAEAARSFEDGTERGPGRPEIGGRVQVRLGDLLSDVDTYAGQHGLNRAGAIRNLVEAGLRGDGSGR